MKTTIKFPKSDSFAFFVTINKITNLLDNMYFTVKENPDDTTPKMQKTLGAGISLVDNRLYKKQLSYKVQIDGADTRFMEPGVRYLFDVKGAIGNAQKTFLAGELILSDTETGYLNPELQPDATAIAKTYNATFQTGAQSEYVETEVDPVAMAAIGDTTGLNTTEKRTVVGAINEVNKPTFTEATERANISSGEKQPTLWGKVQKWFSSLKALAFKNKVETADITNGAVTTAKFASDAECPNSKKSTKADYSESLMWFSGDNVVYDQRIFAQSEKNATIARLVVQRISNGDKFDIVYVHHADEANKADKINTITKTMDEWNSDGIVAGLYAFIISNSSERQTIMLSVFNVNNSVESIGGSYNGNYNAYTVHYEPAITVGVGVPAMFTLVLNGSTSQGRCIEVRLITAY